MRSGSRASVITCKTLVDNTRIPILASFDAEDRPVAIHIDVALISMAHEGVRVEAPSSAPSDRAVMSSEKDRRTLAQVFRRHRRRR